MQRKKKIMFPEEYRSILPACWEILVLIDQALAARAMTQDQKARNGSGSGVADAKLHEHGCLKRAGFKDKKTLTHRKQR